MNSIKQKMLELRETPASNMSAEIDMAGVIRKLKKEIGEVVA